jgi:molybdate transport system substrate-binding protein
MSTRPPSQPTEAAHPDAEWQVGLRVWIERAGQAILGQGRLELLEAIDRHGSISAAARHLGVSYRHAWEMVQGVNAAAGEPLVTAATGGVQGGGARLTPRGRWAIAVFRDLQGHLLQTAATALPRLVERSGEPGLHLAAAVSLEEVVGQLLADFALREPALRVRAVFGGSDELADHILAGTPADLFLSADLEQIDRLVAARLVRPEQAVALARNGLAAIGKLGSAVAIRKAADLARADAPRVALADAGCPLGAYTRAYLGRLHLYEPLLARAVRVENSRAVVAAVRAGLAEVGLVYSSDAAGAAGCRTLFRVRRMPVPIRYSGAIVCRGHDESAAQRLLTFLTSSAAGRRFRQCGFHPPGASRP